MSTPLVDWDRISTRLQDVMRRMVPDEQWTGGDFYAEALRRTFGYQPDNGQGRDYLHNDLGLQAEAYSQYLHEGHAVIERLNREKAEQQVKELRAEMRRVRQEAGKDLADMIRERCNERTVPSKYRRDGVAWAADLIDPTVPKDRFGWPVSPADRIASSDDQPAA